MQNLNRLVTADSESLYWIRQVCYMNALGRVNAQSALETGKLYIAKQTTVSHFAQSSSAFVLLHVVCYVRLRAATMSTVILTLFRPPKKCQPTMTGRVA